MNDNRAPATTTTKPLVPQTTTVAVIGGGVAGLAAAWHLSVNTSHKVVLFESEDRLGGHACTLRVKKDTPIDVDVGFMVMNDPNYPNLTAWFNTLGVELQLSDMSLSVSLDNGAIEWNSEGVVAGMGGVALAKVVLDLRRFHRDASDLLHLDDNDPRRHVTIREYLLQHRYSTEFGTFYLLPMMAALWSASLSDVLQFPAAQLVGFLCNHQMLQVLDRPVWKTVRGRSQVYVERVKQAILACGGQIWLNQPVLEVRKVEGDSGESGSTSKYDVVAADLTVTVDHVVFACHPPTARKILHQGGLRDDWTQLLDDIVYADNVLYLHSDPSLMPTRKDSWASWNCLGRSQELHFNAKNTGEAMEGAESGFGAKADKSDDENSSALEGSEGRMKAVYVTYWLNKLQTLDTDLDLFVSLNPHHPPRSDLMHDRFIMAHPQFRTDTLLARRKLKGSKDGLWFCGAWAGYGFHEDGCRSGFEVATQLSGVPLPWAETQMVLPPPDLARASRHASWLSGVWHRLTHDLPVALCQRFVRSFLTRAVSSGRLRIQFQENAWEFGDGSRCGADDQPVTIRVFDPWFFVKVALEYDLGLARSYMAGHFVIDPLDDEAKYNPTLRPRDAQDETNVAIGDPIGLTRLFLLLIGNRDHRHVPRRAGRGHWHSNALTNASGMLVAKIGSLLNYVWYKLTMDNSEKGGSLKNIRTSARSAKWRRQIVFLTPLPVFLDAHYDISNDLFTTFLDKETLMYSSAIYDAVNVPERGLVFKGTLEQAQWRKLDTLLARAQIQPGQSMLDIGFGWGGLSLHAAKKYGCHVTGITLSVEQKALAEERVRKEKLEHLITFEVCDYRTFARRTENHGRFDRVLSCEMIEAVGHKYLGDFFWTVERVLKRDGILVMEAITTPEERYESYLRSTDFINTVIFPGSCCPSLHALVDAAYHNSCLTLEHIDNIGLHYAQTLAEWRRRFNANAQMVRSLGFDDVFVRAWNYYLTYCEAGFFSQTENCLILVFARPGCQALVPLCETESVTQRALVTADVARNLVHDA